MIKYCPTCNRSSNEARFIGEFCEFCVADKISASILSSAEVEKCRSCGRIRAPEGFVDMDDATLAAALMKSMHLTDCKLEVKGVDEKRQSATVRITCGEGGDRVSFDKTIHVKFLRTMCQSCYRRSSGYYEALVQLRGSPRNVETIAESITKFVEARNGVITRTERVPHGYNMYIVDKELANAYFMMHRSLSPHRSYKLFGVKKGKRLFRNIYSLHLA
jgi:NMD protein affecting ribosome stability and mRNA decay